jgi:hypothetical protein
MFDKTRPFGLILQVKRKPVSPITGYSHRSASNATLS